MRSHSLLVSAIMLMPFSMVADDLLKAIPFEQVTLEDNFWRPRLIIQKYYCPLNYKKSSPTS